MQNRKLLLIGVAILSAIGFSSIAYAQNQQTNIEERISTVGSQTPRTILRPDEAILTGREDLILLIKRQLFEAYINPSYQYTNNAFLSNANREMDKVASVTGGLRFSTVVANKVNMFADLSMTAARYNKYDQLNYNTIQGSVGFNYAEGPWVTSLSYSPNYVYDDKMKDHLVSLHRISGSVSHMFVEWHNVFFTPFVSAQITPSDPNEYGYYQGDLGVQAVVGLPHGLRFSAGPRVYAKKYFDYFETFTGQSRKDTGVSLNANLEWAPNPNVSFSFSNAFTSNDSNLAGNDFDAFTATPSLRLSVHF